MTGFIAFGFATQVLLLAFFSAYRWRPAWATPIGWLVYGFGAVAVILGIALAIDGQASSARLLDFELSHRILRADAG